ncbi:exosome complex component RRP43 [Nematostella vectensis]|uniref:exosome complex component RRP43 n=1 Tax=Nematostella vectensis TaxID=45351 RepID=UPI00207765AB|nr:exosome complex component RRP43 [Nematostella vectensis]
MAADFKTAEPVEYYKQFLKENIRPDGRGLFDFRETILNVGSISTANGSALVKLGNTTVVCGVTAEFAEPAADVPNKGFIVPNVDLPPLCSPSFRPGPPSEHAQVLSTFIDNLITNSQLIDLEDLCIVDGKLVWVLYIDLMCLDYDGNVADAAVIAMLAALQNTRLHTVTINEETETPEPSENKDIHLKLKSMPVAVTFGIFDDDHIYCDPTDEEERLASGKVSVVMTTNNKVVAVHKPGGPPLTQDKLQECFDVTTGRVLEVQQLIHTACTNVPDR